MTVFQHGVASGDPLLDRVVIWTRVEAAPAQAVEVEWWVAPEAGGGSVAARGVATAEPARDHTVQVDVTGLDPATRYRYGFRVGDETSPVGRTRTLAADPARVRFAMVSCAKYNAGFFNAYGRLAARDDIDFVLHLGDYIYEASNTPPASQTPGAGIGRDFDPLHECKTLDDYRRRYAQYHRDPDLQTLHARHPMMATWDDHEFADGAWAGGATEHDPRRDGPWAARRAAAAQARWEWVPGRMPDPGYPERVFRAVPFGDLADLFLLDTRTRRHQPVEGDAASDPDRSVLGPAQCEWLFGQLERSTAAWRLVANPSILSQTWDPAVPADALPGLIKLKLCSPNGQAPDADQWDGYPAERDVLLERLARAGDVVVLSGDIHVGLALELRHHPQDTTETPAGVEFVTSSLTSQNLDDKMKWPAGTQSVPTQDAFVAGLPNARWCDFDRHGYVLVDVDPERVRGEWWFVDTVLQPSPVEERATAWLVRKGTPRLMPG